MNPQNVLVFLVVTLSFVFAAASVVPYGETVDDDRDLFIREHENGSCTLMEYLFGSKYHTNETTECECAKMDLTRCITTIIHNSTAEKTPDSDSANVAVIDTVSVIAHKREAASAFANENDGEDGGSSDESDEE